jgi:hypothetical protein
VQHPVRFIERRRELEALPVTADNLAAVAHWCGGHVISDHTGPVAVGVPIGRSILRALPGQWVIRRIGSDGSVHHQPVPEQELYFAWEPCDAGT